MLSVGVICPLVAHTLCFHAWQLASKSLFSITEELYCHRDSNPGLYLPSVTVPCGSPWYPVVPRGILWFPVVPCGSPSNDTPHFGSLTLMWGC